MSTTNWQTNSKSCMRKKKRDASMAGEKNFEHLKNIWNNRGTFRTTERTFETTEEHLEQQRNIWNNRGTFGTTERTFETTEEHLKQQRNI